MNTASEFGRSLLEKERARRRMKGISPQGAPHQVKEGYESIGEKGLTMKSKILSLLGEHPEGLTMKQMVQELAGPSENSMKSYRSAISTLHKKKLIKTVGEENLYRNGRKKRIYGLFEQEAENENHN